jgi:hypothetical protein
MFLDKKPQYSTLLNMWLQDYYGVTYEDIQEDVSSSEFFVDYPVTIEQYGRWENKAIVYVAMITGYSYRYAKKVLQYAMLDVGPMIRPRDEIKKQKKQINYEKL